MVVLFASTIAASLWIVLIALGNKPFDALLLCALIVLIGATYQIVAPRRRR